jgi:hypothetical protein
MGTGVKLVPGKRYPQRSACYVFSRSPILSATFAPCTIFMLTSAILIPRAKMAGFDYNGSFGTSIIMRFRHLTLYV